MEEIAIEAASNLGLKLDDLPSGDMSSPKPPVHQAVFCQYQPIASSIETVTTDFATLVCSIAVHFEPLHQIVCKLSVVNNSP